MAALPDTLVEAVLVRIAPDEPALLVRAAVSCKRWRRLVSGPGFRRKLRERHRRRRPPMLGAVRSSMVDDVVSFIPTFSIRPPRVERRGWWALDSRHGRVVLIQSSPRSRFDVGRALAVWDPVADKLRELPMISAPPGLTWWSSLNATVVCACAATGSAAADCDHIDCPFHVVFLGSDYLEGKFFAYLYSSKADAWSEPTSAPCFGEIKEQKLVPHLGNSLCFLLMARILEYNLVTRELTVIDPPAMRHDSVVLSDAVEGGRLGCVMMAGYNLHLWSREAVGPDGEMGWVESRVIEMATTNPLSTVIPKIICYRDASGLIYDGTKYGPIPKIKSFAIAGLEEII